MGMTVVPHRRRQEIAEMLLTETRDATGRAAPSAAQVADEAARRMLPFDMLLEAVEAGWLVRAEGRMIDMPINQVIERCRLTLGRSITWTGRSRRSSSSCVSSIASATR